MSLKIAKKQLMEMLGDEDHKVIALSGKWGIGKTTLWEQVKLETEDEKVKGALYVSLFGLSSIDQLKGKLLEASIPLPDSEGDKVSVIAELFTATSTYLKTLETIAKVGTSLLAPKVLCNKLIVIDDIERRDVKLGISEILGFIDEYSVQHSAQFVLILNEEKIPQVDDQKVLWVTFREKVIDHEVKLSTTPKEAFEIAIKLMPSRYADVIKKASSTCNLTNIRIIKKIIKTTNKLLAERDLEATILARVVPSIVLFTAIYLNGMDEGLDFKFAINIGNVSDDYAKRLEQDFDPENLTSEELKADEWRDLIYELGILSCNEFENQLVRFLESGLYKKAGIDVILDRYIKEQGEIEAKGEAEEFIERVYWDCKSNDSQLLEKATRVTSNASLLDPFLITKLHSTLDELPFGKELARELLTEWIQAYLNGKTLTKSIDNPFSQRLHEDIQTAHDKKTEALYKSGDLKEVVLGLKLSSEFNTFEEFIMKNAAVEYIMNRATVEDFRAVIDGLDMEEMRPFMMNMIKTSSSKPTGDTHFDCAGVNFIEACKNIVADPPTPRLAFIISKILHASYIPFTPPPTTLDNKTQ